ncbi:uncharacterized protein LOC144151929 [Haemaphysalis longicornis]
MAITLRSAAVILFVQMLFQYKEAQCEVVDVIKMIGNFRKMTAIRAPSSTAGDDNLECLRADLTEYDPEAGTGTYIWYLQDIDGNDKTIQHNISRGSSPDRVQVVTSANPSAPFTAVVPYTDYKTCFILETKEFGGQCMLWANDTFKDNVPKKCLSKYRKYCGDGVSLYNEACSSQ